MKVFCVIIGYSLLAVTSAASLNISSIYKELVPTDKRISSQGYPAESHFVETEDGYMLNLFRIPYSHKLQNQYILRPAVLLLHGLFGNSECWISSGKDNALAYLLADAGFDVWLGNARGNMYSRKNTKISVNHPNFWRFDWHEIGKTDMPAMIDYIIGITGEQQIHYVGHSQGTTAYFVMMSERPEYNAKIKTAHMLAPCAFFEHTASVVVKLFRPLIGKPGGVWNKFLSNMEIMSQNNLIANITNMACETGSPLEIICKNAWLCFAGDSYTNTNLTALQYMLETNPSGSSSNQGIHYVQLSDHNKGRFCQMDYGPKENVKKYLQENAPDYNLDNIKAATYLYSSLGDVMCTPQDVNTLIKKVPQLAGNYRVPLKDFNHFDFLIAENVKELINDRVIKIILKYEDILLIS